MNKVSYLAGTCRLNSFEPWKTYFTSILNSAWLTCLAKINIYQIPKRDKWVEWDERCIKGRSPNVSRTTYHSIMEQVDKQIPVISYKDKDGSEKTFSTSTHTFLLPLRYRLNEFPQKHASTYVGVSPQSSR